MPWFDDLLRPQLGQIHAYRPAACPAGAVRLDANESPYALEPHARRYLADALAAVDSNRYPDVRATRLRDAIASRTGAHPDQLVIGCGSDEVIGLIINTLAVPRPGRPRPTFVFPEPSFVMFKISALAAGADAVGVPLGAQWDLDAAAMLEACDRHAPHAVFLPSPNNPTGNLFADDAIDAIVAASRGRSLVVIDEAYGRFSHKTYTQLREREEHVGQLQTLSKLGLAAARVGWAILPRDLAAAIDKVRQPYNLNAFSQRAAELALGELAPEFDRAVDRIIAERARLSASLAALPGVVVTPSSANFVWLDLGRDAAGVYDALLAHGVVVRSFHGAGGRLARCLRITVGTPNENDRLLDALRAIVVS